MPANMNQLVSYQIPSNETRIQYDSSQPLFIEISSNPIYYEKLHSYGLVRKETVEAALEITKNMSTSLEKSQADKILRVIYFILNIQFWFFFAHIFKILF
jgi:hypothetical protein